MRRAAYVVLVLVATLLAPLPTQAAPVQVRGGKQFHKAPGFTPPPVTADCLGLTAPHGCMWDVGDTTFTLSSHVVHVGGTLSVSSRSGWKEQHMVLDGPGLKLKKSHQVPGVSFTASWKATQVTGRHWVYNAIGNRIQVPGSAAYLRSDYYAVVDKDAAVLEGRVLDTIKDPVRDQDVLIEGLGKNDGDDYYATTSDDGSFDAVLPVGPWKVCPRAVDAHGVDLPGWDCDAGHFTPGKRQVTLRKGKTAKVGFTLESRSRLVATPAASSLAADGTQQTTVTFRMVDHWGNGLAGHDLTITPNQQGSTTASLTPAALVCDGQGIKLWPMTYPTDTSTGGPVTERTDSSGAVTVTVVAGYRPGSWSVSALDTSSTAEPQPYASTTLTFTAIPNGPTWTQLHDDANGAVNGSVPFTGNETDVNDLWNWVDQLAQTTWFKGYEMLPVQPEHGPSWALMLWPVNSPPTIDPVTGKVIGDYAQARVIEPTTDDNIRAVMGGLPHTLPTSWSAQAWRDGTSSTITARGFATLQPNRTVGYTRYGNFPIPTGAERAACGDR